MARKHKHEEHTNHEAWAIPYGDLVTLLLALFVVMYSMSVINEGKFRVASDSLNAAFHGKPRAPTPVQIGPPKPPQNTSSSSQRPQILQSGGIIPGMRSQGAQARPTVADPGNLARNMEVRERRKLEKMAEQVHQALGGLIDQKLVVVRRHEDWLEIEIQTDILFASGSAQLGDRASFVLDRLADALKDFNNRLRIEGHTDNVPIATREFPSNWELSSARAASVVHRFMAHGLDPHRMTVLGLAEYQPMVANDDETGRNRNRRVVIVVLANEVQPMPSLSPTAALDGADAAGAERALSAVASPATDATDAIDTAAAAAAPAPAGAGVVATATQGRSQP